MTYLGQLLLTHSFYFPKLCQKTKATVLAVFWMFTSLATLWFAPSGVCRAKNTPFGTGFPKLFTILYGYLFFGFLRCWVQIWTSEGLNLICLLIGLPTLVGLGPYNSRSSVRPRVPKILNDYPLYFSEILHGVTTSYGGKCNILGLWK